MLPVMSERIEVTPGVCGGRPRIAGHRITVQQVVLWHERMGLSPGQIASRYPGITPADVHAALAYYQDHKEEVLARIRDDEEFVSRLRGEAPAILERLSNRDAPDDPVPPG